MQLPSPQPIELVPWFCEKIVLPSAFIILDALIGFMSTSIRDWNEAHRAKKAFLRAIRRELVSIDKQLSTAIEEVKSANKRLLDDKQLPGFTLSFRTVVYSSQLSKLRDLDDPVLLDIVGFYSDLNALDGIVALLNENSKDAENRRPPKLGDSIEVANQSAAFHTALAKTGSACRILLERISSVSALAIISGLTPASFRSVNFLLKAF